jgi:uroporphyrinogen decarboxylase
MTKRENFLRALMRDKPQSVPFDINLCPLQLETFKNKTHSDDYKTYFEVPFRTVEIEPTVRKTDFTHYYQSLPDNAKPLSWNPEWGVYCIPGSVAHFEEMRHPMKHFETIDEILTYPFPDFNEPYRWKGMGSKIVRLHESGLASVANLENTVFEIAWYLRGMEDFMMDIIDNREFAIVLLNKITDIRIGMAEKFAGYGVDIIKLGDDVSTQLGMMISPSLWRELFKPRLAEIIRVIKKTNPDTLVFYHGDGNLQAIIPDLIEIGIEILNPVQPECMDPVFIKKQYGGKISFWGALGTQTVLPFGTPFEVEMTVKEMIETAGSGGGLVLAPTHVVEPDVPWENIEAFAGAVKKYGVY